MGGIFVIVEVEYEEFFMSRRLWANTIALPIPKLACLSRKAQREKICSLPGRGPTIGNPSHECVCIALHL